MLAINNITFKIKERVILNNVSLKIEPKNITALVGPNGAGKTTLLKLCCGLLSPDTGDITLNNNEISKIPLKKLALHRALVSQKEQISYPIKVLDYVLLARLPYQNGKLEENDYKLALYHLAAVDAEYLIDSCYQQISAGEQQRVQLARALTQLHNVILDNKYLLLDEHTAHLDLSHQLSSFSLLKEISAKHNMGILVIVHDINLALRFADQIALLHNGKLTVYDNDELNFDAVKSMYQCDMYIHKNKFTNKPVIIVS